MTRREGLPQPLQIISVTEPGGMGAVRAWSISRDQASALAESGIDWFALRECPTATLVKRNSHRDVWRVRSGEREYFAKLYHPNGFVARLKLLLRGPIALTEWEVGRYAAAHGIAAVVPVATAWSRSRGGVGPSLLITEAVPAATPLNEYWTAVRGNRRRSKMLADSLAKLIARAHQCGFQHGDMHPGNILVRSDESGCEAFFVDLHTVRISRAVRERQLVANLAQLNQWFRSHATRSQRLWFLRRYLAYRDQYATASPLARNWNIDLGQLVRLLAARVERHANQLWSKRDRRMFRTGRYFTRIRPGGEWRGHALLSCKHPGVTAGASKLRYTRKQWEQWLGDPLAWVDRDRQRLVKDSHTATICRATLPTDPPYEVIAKRPLARDAWKRLGQIFGPSRNRRAWRLANMLRHRDLPAAHPLAVVERFALGIFRVDSVSLTEYIPDSVDLETFLTRDVQMLPAGRQREIKDRLIHSVAGLLKAFHERGFAHRDLKAPNLLVTWQPPYEGRPLLTFVDMDGISFAGRPSEGQKLRAVTRLCASLLSSPGCTSTDRLRFLRSYLSGPGRTVSKWKEHWRIIHDEVCSKLADKEVRRKWKLAHYGRE